MKEREDILLQKLDEFIRKFYRNEIVRGLIIALSVSLAFFLIFTIAEYFGRFGQGFRSLLFWSYIAILSVVFGRWFVIPVMHFMRIGKIISYTEAARIIGRHFGEVRDLLLNTLQLQELAGIQSDNSELLLAGIRQKTEQLRPVPFTLAINLKANLSYLKYLAIPLLALVLILVASPGIITKPTERLVRYSHEFPVEFPYQIRILNESMQGVQQDDMTLLIQVSGEELPASVSVVMEDGSSFEAHSESKILFTYTFRKLRRNFSFRLSSGEYISAPYEVTVIPKPIVLGFTIRLDYPAYTDRESEVIDNSGDITVPAGTRATWQLLTRDADIIYFRAGLHTDTLKPTDNRTSVRMLLTRNTDYSFLSANQFLKNPDSLHYTVQVIPDAFPGISVDESRDSLDDRRLYFMGRVEDDYGFRKLEFRYRRVVAGDSGLAFTVVSLPIDPGQLRQSFFHHLDLASLGIRAGQSYEYYFEVWDNDAVNGSKSSKSERFIYRAPDEEEIEEINRQQGNSIRNSMESSILEARKLQKDIDEFYRKAADKKELGWQERKQLENLLKRQKDLKASAEEAFRQQQEKNRLENMFKEIDPELLAKQQELERLMEELITGELADLLKELEKLMEKIDKEQVNEMLDKMKLGAEDLEKTLDRNLELFKQLEFEKKLEESISELEGLSKKQEELSKESLEKDADPAALKEKQDALNKEFEEFRQDLQESRELNKALEEPNKMGETAEQEQEIGEQMGESSESLDKGQKKKASGQQQDASEGMEKLSESLRKMQEDMAMDQMGEDIHAIRELLENLVQVSFDQEDLMSRIQGISKNDPKYIGLVQKQKKIHDDLGMIQDSLLALSKRQAMIQPFVNKEVSEIRLNSQRAIDALSDNRGIEVNTGNYLNEAMNRQQYVMTSVNNLALLLDESLNQMQQQMNSMKSKGNKSCNNPRNMGSGKKSVKSMRQMQEALNKELESLKKGMEKGQKQVGGKSVSEQLARMAAEQEAIRRQMQDYMNSLGKEGLGQQGQLSKLMEEMEQTERDLVNKVINNNTLLRQQDILTRLLESEKAERERELDDKRESKEPKKYDISNPEGFFEYNGVKSKESELLQTVPPMLRQYYKQKVNDYLFNQ